MWLFNALLRPENKVTLIENKSEDLVVAERSVHPPLEYRRNLTSMLLDIASFIHALFYVLFSAPTIKKVQ